MGFFKVQQRAVADSDQEVGAPLGHVGCDLEGAIVVEESQREHAILAGIVVVDTGHIRIVKGQCRALGRVLVQSRYVTGGDAIKQT